MPIVSLIAVIASCLLGYMLQKNCEKFGVRFRGKKLSDNKKMVIADVLEVYIKDNEYFAKCRIQGTLNEPTIKIDKAMMAAMPDTASGNGKPISQVLLYETGNSDTNKDYELTPEEIRFKIKLKVIRNDESTEAEIQNAKEFINFYYDVRLVLWTLAWVGVYRSPILSIVFSALAGLISVRNIIPLRYTKLKKCGIINTKNNSKAPAKEQSSVPPGFDNWSEESRYMYNLEQRVEAQRSSGNPDTQRPAEEADIEESHDNAELPESTDDAPEDESEEDEEDAPFFTDEELASEGVTDKDDEEDDVGPNANGTSESVDMDEEDDDEDSEFDADGYECDGLDADVLSEPETKESEHPPEEPETEQAKEKISEAAEEPPAPASRKSNPVKRPSLHHGGRKTVKSVLDNLMGETENEND